MGLCTFLSDTVAFLGLRVSKFLNFHNLDIDKIIFYYSTVRKYRVVVDKKGEIMKPHFVFIIPIFLFSFLFNAGHFEESREEQPSAEDVSAREVEKRRAEEAAARKEKFAATRALWEARTRGHQPVADFASTVAVAEHRPDAVELPTAMKPKSFGDIEGLAMKDEAPTAVKKPDEVAVGQGIDLESGFVRDDDILGSVVVHEAAEKKSPEEAAPQQKGLIGHAYDDARSDIDLTQKEDKEVVTKDTWTKRWYDAKYKVKNEGWGAFLKDIGKSLKGYFNRPGEPSIPLSGEPGELFARAERGGKPSSEVEGLHMRLKSQLERQRITMENRAKNFHIQDLYSVEGVGAAKLKIDEWRGRGSGSHFDDAGIERDFPESKLKRLGVSLYDGVGKAFDLLQPEAVATRVLFDGLQKRFNRYLIKEHSGRPISLDTSKALGFGIKVREDGEMLVALPDEATVSERFEAEKAKLLVEIEKAKGSAREAMLNRKLDDLAKAKLFLDELRGRPDVAKRVVDRRAKGAKMAIADAKVLSDRLRSRFLERTRTDFRKMFELERAIQEAEKAWPVLKGVRTDREVQATVEKNLNKPKVKKVLVGPPKPPPLTSSAPMPTF